MLIEIYKQDIHDNSVTLIENISDLNLYSIVFNGLSNKYLKIKNSKVKLAHQLDKEEIFTCHCNKKVVMLDENRTLSNITNSPSVESGEYDSY